MSFPNIPDINPCIDIKQEDAVNLLLTSISMEEMSLSGLIDAETHKILCVMDDCCRKDHTLTDALCINKSVNETIKNITKLQMLLQFKLENVREFFPPQPLCPPPPCPPPPCPPPPCPPPPCPHPCPPPCPRKHCCSLKGTGRGCVTNRSNEFCGNIAVLHAFIFSDDKNSRNLRYTVKSDEAELSLLASGCNIKVECPHHCYEELVIHGKGRVEKHSHCGPDISVNADFILSVWEKVQGILEFKMEIESECEPALRHNSGIVPVKESCSDIRLLAII